MCMRTDTGMTIWVDGLNIHMMRKEGIMKRNNIETAKDVKQSKRIRLAEERDDPEQTIINISPDIFEMLQD